MRRANPPWPSPSPPLPWAPPIRAGSFRQNLPSPLPACLLACLPPCLSRVRPRYLRGPQRVQLPTNQCPCRRREGVRVWLTGRPPLPKVAVPYSPEGDKCAREKVTPGTKRGLQHPDPSNPSIQPSHSASLSRPVPVRLPTHAHTPPPPPNLSPAPCHPVSARALWPGCYAGACVCKGGAWMGGPARW